MREREDIELEAKGYRMRRRGGFFGAGARGYLSNASPRRFLLDIDSQAFRLRDPSTSCHSPPWDPFATCNPHTLGLIFNVAYHYGTRYLWDLFVNNGIVPPRRFEGLPC